MNDMFYKLLIRYLFMLTVPLRMSPRDLPGMSYLSTLYSICMLMRPKYVINQTLVSSPVVIVVCLKKNYRNPKTLGTKIEI